MRDVGPAHHRAADQLQDARMVQALVELDFFGGLRKVYFI